MKIQLTLEWLEDRLSEPTPGVIESLRRLPGDVAVLGVGGKMGVTVARMARRALDQLGRRHDCVIGVARFSSKGLPERLHQCGVEPRVSNLLDRDAVRLLPDTPNIIFMAGQKFGTAESTEVTWAMNTLVPANVAEKFRSSRIVVFSTGCVYPLVPIASGGSREDDALGPPGDYANSCVGRERIFSYFSGQYGTAVAIYRLNYAIDLRYGVLLDIASKVWRGEAVDVTMGHVNVIWQGDAAAMALQCLTHSASPPFVVNVTGLETIAIRSLAERFGKLLGRVVKFAGQEASTAWLSNAMKAQLLFGGPTVSLDQMIDWTAEWVRCDGPTLDKPTHFEVRDGRF